MFTDLSKEIAAILEALQKIFSAVATMAEADVRKFVNKIFAADVATLVEAGLVDAIIWAAYSLAASSSLPGSSLLLSLLLAIFGDELGLDSSHLLS